MYGPQNARHGRTPTGRDEIARVSLSEGFHYRRDEPKKRLWVDVSTGLATQHVLPHCFRHLARWQLAHALPPHAMPQLQALSKEDLTNSWAHMAKHHINEVAPQHRAEFDALASKNGTAAKPAASRLASSSSADA